MCHSLQCYSRFCRPANPGLSSGDSLGEGLYSEVATYFYALLLLIGTLRFWLQKQLLPIYLLAVFYYLPPQAQISWELVWRFISEDIIPR